MFTNVNGSLDIATTVNIVSCIITIASIFFSSWIYMRTRKKESIEREKINGYISRLNDISLIIRGITNQVALLGNMADREETTKKELKHLAISMLSVVNSVHEIVNSGLESLEKWSFGIPTTYVYLRSEHRIKNDEVEIEKVNGQTT